MHQPNKKSNRCMRKMHATTTKHQTNEVVFGRLRNRLAQSGPLFFIGAVAAAEAGGSRLCFALQIGHLLCLDGVGPRWKIMPCGGVNRCHLRAAHRSCHRIKPCLGTPS